jgi:hypothetical protein
MTNLEYFVVGDFPPQTLFMHVRIQLSSPEKTVVHENHAKVVLCTDH